MSSSTQFRGATTSPASSLTEPLFLQVRNLLRKEILAKRLRPGAKLPSESDIQVAFSVSRITVRKALSELSAEGLIETVNGKGSFVTRPANAPLLGQLAGFNAVMHSRGLRTSGYLISALMGKIDSRASHALSLQANTEVMTITTMRIVENSPTAISILVCEPDMGQQLLSLEVESKDVMELLEEKLELHLESAQIEASAVSASAEDSELLGISLGTPLLVMHFVPYNMLGQPLLYAEMRFRNDRFSYRTVVKR